MTKQKSTQEQEGAYSSDGGDTGIGKRSRLFFILCTAIVCLVAIIFWGLKSFSPSASESTSGSKAAFMTEIASRQKASDLLQKEMLGIAGELVGEFPSNERLRILAVEAHHMCYNYPQAKALLKEGIGLNPKYGEFYQRLAGIASYHGQYDKAITFWKKTLEVSPERLNLNADIAEAFISLGKYREAIEELQKNKISQGSARVYYLLGQGYLQLKEYDESKKYFEKAIEIRPNYPDANYGLATVYMRLKQRDKAEHYMKLFRQSKAGRVNYKSDIAEKRDKTTIYDTSTSELEVFPETFVKLCIEGRNLYTKNRNLDKVLRLFNKGENTFVQAIKIAPEAPGIYREFAYFYLVMNKKLAETKELANKAVALEGSAKNYYILCSALYRNSDQPNALKALEKAVELDPGNLMYKQAFDEISRNK